MGKRRDVENAGIDVPGGAGGEGVDSGAGADSGEGAEGGEVRERVLRTASELFYREGVRAVGVDRIVARAGVAKTSLYRHFRTKDELIAAFLEREDADFWGHWEAVSARCAGDPRSELDAQLRWIGERLARPGYRGCPQLNVAAEFAAPDHPARLIAARHKLELRRRLRVLVERLGARDPEMLASQLALLIDGAFTSGPLLFPAGATEALLGAAQALLAAAGARSTAENPSARLASLPPR